MSEPLEKLVELVAVESGLKREEIAQALKAESKIELPEDLVHELPEAEVPSATAETEGSEKAKEVDLNDVLYKIINDLTIPQKIKLALFGNQTARGLLIRDKNRVIPMFVLQNARITENELFEFARNTNLSDAVLRVIAGNPEWMKTYRMKFAVCSNPKMPIDVSVKWVKFLQKQDLRRLSKSKNIPQVVANQARKLIE